MITRMKRSIKFTTFLISFWLIAPAWSLETETARTAGDAATPARVITADWQKAKGPHSEMFHECIGAGRAAEGLRADWQHQLKMCQDEIGFKYIRFHGLLCDDMGVYAETKDGQPRHNWQYIDALYDSLLAMNLRPFVEISFMPDALASGKQTIFWWKANVTPPKAYEKWDDLIKDLVTHWTARYGANEVKQWNFEIWNEADYPAFFGPRDPDRRREEYFELYAHTAADIKSVNANYCVGGPAGSQTVWIQPLIEFCRTNHSPLDFISFHTYGLGGGASGLDENGDQFLYLGENLRAPADTMANGRGLVDVLGKTNLPVHITEWSASYSPRDPIHDSYFSAPYILEQFKHSERGINSMSYWVFTDIFEENGPALTPFHGGFGLLNLQGIKKPAYFAYQFMARLGMTELKNDDDASWVCRDEHGGTQILLWDLTRPADKAVSNQAIFRKLNPARSKGSVRVNLMNLPPGNYRLALRQIGFEKNDAYSAYLKMNAPSQLTRAQEKALRDAASGKPEFERVVKIGADGKFSETLPLRENDVLLLTLTRP
jgi:xylan 1,4-beta-xylosidase